MESKESHIDAALVMEIHVTPDDLSALTSQMKSPVDSSPEKQLEPSICEQSSINDSKRLHKD